MEAKKLIVIKLGLWMVVVLMMTVTVRGGDYIRPPPRKTLHFPWTPKHPSLPQQVLLSPLCMILFAKIKQIKLCCVLMYVVSLFDSVSFDSLDNSHNPPPNKRRKKKNYTKTL